MLHYLKNDFIILTVITHGSSSAFYVAHETLSIVGGEIVRGKDVDYTTLSEKINISWGNTAQTRKYARVVSVIASCYSGDGAKILATGDQRIGIASSSVTELAYATMGTNVNYAFLYKGKHKDGWYQETPYDGFILSLGTASSTQSIRHAFDCGYTAATNNHFDGNPIDPSEHYDSHPELYADGNGTPNETTDRNIAKCIYL